MTEDQDIEGAPDAGRHIERHVLEWQGIRIAVSYEPNWLNLGDITGCHAHLQVESVTPDRAPLPITGTGYRSHFTHATTIDSFGGAVAFVEAWLDEEACKPAWREYARQSRQLALF